MMYKEQLVAIHPECFIRDEFNLHLDTQSTATSSSDGILATSNLKQHVTFSTHILDHWLHLLITRYTPGCIHTLTAIDGLSDHFTVIA